MSAHSEPTNEPGQEPDEDEADDEKDAEQPAKGKTVKDPDTEDDAGWDRERQAEDEAAARRGESKADLRRQLQEERAQRAELERQLNDGGKDRPRGDAKADESALKWEDLPEVDDYDGKPLPQNKAINAAMKAMLAQNAALQDQVEEITGAVSQRENREAYRTLLRAATKENPDDRDEVNKRVKAEWAKRRYTKDFYPDADQTADIVRRMASDVHNERLRRELEEARKNRGRGPANDTGQGGRRANPRRPATIIEPDFEKAFRAQKKAGAFNDVMG